MEPIETLNRPRGETWISFPKAKFKHMIVDQFGEYDYNVLCCLLGLRISQMRQK